MPVGDRPAEPLSGDDVRRLLAAADDGTMAGRRNYALLVVTWRTGLRCAEVLALRSSDVDLAGGTLRVLHGKGNRARTIGIDSGTAEVVAKWQVERESLGLNGGVLFCTVSGQAGRPLDPRYVRALMSRLGRKAGIDHRVHLHGLRHSCAVDLRREGWPVPLISRQLGHSSIATTQVYLDHMLPLEAVELAQRREWV